MNNTIDLRGLEQSITRLQAEEFAATCHYDMMFFGYHEEPQDVNPSRVSKDGTVDELFWSAEEHKIFREKGHKLIYPRRQYCAGCGAAAFSSEINEKCPTY